MKASIVMTLCNRADLLQLTVRRYSEYPESKQAELVVVDDMSTDHIGRVLNDAAKAFGRVVWIRMDKNLSRIPIVANNPALGINIGVKAARSEIIIKTDPECYPLTNVVEATLRRWNPNNLTFARCVRAKKPINRRAQQHFEQNLPMPGEADFDRLARGAWETKHFISERFKNAYWFTAVFSRPLFMKIGGVDEKFLGGFAGEDDEWAERMRRNGVRYNWTDDIAVVHLWHPPPQRKPEWQKQIKEWHTHNTNLLWHARQINKKLANEQFDWGSDSAVVSRKVIVEKSGA